jgi:hypothetical protein
MTALDHDTSAHTHKPDKQLLGAILDAMPWLIIGSGAETLHVAADEVTLHGVYAHVLYSAWFAPLERFNCADMGLLWHEVATMNVPLASIVTDLTRGPGGMGNSGDSDDWCELFSGSVDVRDEGLPPEVRRGWLNWMTRNEHWYQVVEWYGCELGSMVASYPRGTRYAIRQAKVANRERDRQIAALPKGGRIATGMF